MTCTKNEIDWNCESPCCEHNREIVRDMMAEYKKELAAKDAEIERLKKDLSEAARVIQSLTPNIECNTSDFCEIFDVLAGGEG